MSQNLATKLFQPVKCEQGAGDIQRDHSGCVCIWYIFLICNVFGNGCIY